PDDLQVTAGRCGAMDWRRAMEQRGTRRRRGPRALVAALALAVTASAGSGASAVFGPVPAGAQSPTAFAASGIDGGGFVNVVAVDPRRTGVVLAGGDVSGIHRS